MTDSKIESLKKHPGVRAAYARRVKLSRDGKELVGLCPFHSEKTGSFHVYQHDGVWLWKCFGATSCGSGNIFQFLEKLDGCNFSAAVKKLEAAFGTAEKEAVDKIFKPIGDKVYNTVSMEKWQEFERALENSKEGREFLEKRGITYDTAKNLRLGLRSNIGGKGQSAVSDNQTGAWIAFPSISNSSVISIKYRSVQSKKFARQPGMETACFNLESVDALEPIYVTEGEFDTCILEQFGFRAISIPNAVARLTPQEKDKLDEAECIILAGDNDGPGIEAMNRLRAELDSKSGEPRVFILKWPGGAKDANETFLRLPTSERAKKFPELVKELTKEARSQIMPYVFSLQESMEAGNKLRLVDHPHRWHAPWPGVDKMVCVLPGGVISISGTNSGVGKTTFAMNAEIYEATKYGEVVLNYSGELSPDEYDNIVAAHIIKKDRLNIQLLDYKLAAKKLQGIKFYTGYNPDLHTITPVLDLIEAGIRRLGATRVILDHLHFFCLNEDNPVEAQAAAMQRIKSMAQKYGVIFLVLGQPRKATQNTKGRPLHITDGKGSEAFGSTCDVFLALHREQAKLTDAENPPRDPYMPETQVHLLKGRSLGSGSSFAMLYARGEIATFRETIAASPDSGENLFEENA